MADHNSLASLFQDIANKIRKLKGVPESLASSNTIVADQFPGSIESIEDIYLPYKLPGYAVTVQKSSGTTTYTVNDHIRIYGSDNKLYTLKQWNDMWVANGKTITGMPTPLGYAFDKFNGEIEVLHFEDQNFTTYYDPYTFTTARTSIMCHSLYNVYSTVWFTTIQKVVAWNGIWDVTMYDADKRLVDIYCNNTKQHFFLKTTRTAIAGTNGVAVSSANPLFSKTGDNMNFEERSYNMWMVNEWLRHRFAINSGLTISDTGDDELPNGTVRKVEIFNSSGNTAAVNEDMYFWIWSPQDIEYKNTGLLAKYNKAWTTNGTTYSPTDTQINNLYAKEKAAGVNMNNTGINSSTKRQFVPGIRGAEAIMVDGEWFITTPVPSYMQGSGANNIPTIYDSPSVYYCRSKGLSLPSNEGFYRYSCNYSDRTAALYNYLTSVEGWTLKTPVLTEWFWTSLLYQNNPGTFNARIIQSSVGFSYISNNNNYYRTIPSHRYKPTESKSIYITIPEEQIHQNVRINTRGYSNDYDLYDLVASSKVLYWADDFTNSVGDKLYINDELFGTCLETAGEFCTEDESNWVTISQSGDTYSVTNVDMREPWGLLKTRLDYSKAALYCDGVAYIDLGTKGNAITDAFEITFKSNTGGQQQRFIAPIDSAATVANCTCSMYINGSNRYGYCWNKGWQGLNTDPPGNISYNKHTWKCDFKNKKHTIDGATYNFVSGAAQDLESGSNMLVVGPSNVSNATRFIGEVYNVKMWRNDVLIRDLTPCGHNPDDEGDNTPGMYDEVNGVYYTNAADSGSFSFIPAAN